MTTFLFKKSICFKNIYFDATILPNINVFFYEIDILMLFFLSLLLTSCLLLNFNIKYIIHKISLWIYFVYYVYTFILCKNADIHKYEYDTLFFYKMWKTSFLDQNLTLFIGLVLYIYYMFYLEEHIKKQKLLKHFTILLILFKLLIFLIKSNNFFFFFVCFLGSNLIIYFLIFFTKVTFSNHEALLKYFYISTLITCLFAYLTWIIFELFGTKNFYVLNLYIWLFIKNKIFVYCMYIIIIILFTIVSFKLAVFPCHFWTPEIYQNSKFNLIFLLGICLKIIFFVFLLKITQLIFFILFDFYEKIYWLSSFLSVIIGTLGALYERNLKAFFAFSSLTQFGIALAIFASTVNNLYYTGLYFLIIYTLNSCLFFYVLIKINNYNRRLKFNFTDHFIFFSQKHWKATFLIIGVLFSFAGIPPFSGFFSKYLILLELAKNQKDLLLIIILTFSLLMIFYYILIVKKICFNKDKKDFKQTINNDDLYNFSFFLNLINFCWYFCHKWLIFFLIYITE